MVSKRKTKTPQVYVVQTGDGLFGNLARGAWKGIKKAAGFAKDQKLLSKGLALVGRPGLASVASMAGLGKPKPRRKPRSQAGAGKKPNKGKRNIVS